MRFRQYLKDHWILFLCLFFAMLLISCLLLIMRLSGEGILFINLLVWMFLLIAILIDFIRKKKFYDNVMHNLETLDKKYLLHELLDPPHFAEGDILCEVLYQCNKSMADEVSVYRNHSKHGYMKLKHPLPRHLWSTKIIKHLPHKVCMKKF